ncbi:MAG: tetratricopeptide repeat protein [Spirochaetes bacterium]|nr:tetratricopeptide repeat protein [Spirochaetota bacterium]
MKRVCLLVCLILLPVSMLCAATDYASLYNEANDRYAAGQYQEALDLYSDLLERGVVNPSLYYNTANTYFKLGQIGYARLYYERALRLSPFDRDVRNNLSYLEGSLSERIVPLYSESIFKNFSKIGTYINERMVTYIELFLLTAFAAVTHLFLLLPSMRDKTRRWMYTSGILFFLSLGCGVLYRMQTKHHPRGVVTRAQVEVLSAPVEESDASFVLHEGGEVLLKESRGEWIRVWVPDGREGWTKANMFDFI